MHAFIMTADKALKKLKEGNEKYLHAETSRGNISRMLRKYTHENIPMRLSLPVRIPG